MVLALLQYYDPKNMKKCLHLLVSWYAGNIYKAYFLLHCRCVVTDTAMLYFFMVGKTIILKYDEQNKENYICICYFQTFP